MRIGGLLALVAVAFASSCSGSGYTYVANNEEQVYFKVPDEWSVFDEAQIIVPRQGFSAQQAEQLQERIWLRGFSADGDSTNVFATGSDEPRGFAQVLQLTSAERDTIDPVALRANGFPDDPDTEQPIDPRAALTDPDAPVELLELDETVVLADGAHGARVTARVEAEIPFVFSQTTVVDARTTRLYIFSVGCKVSCWEQHEEELMEIADSWTLEATTDE